MIFNNRGRLLNKVPPLLIKEKGSIPVMKKNEV
jgi:hypothetical protein